MPWYLPDRNPLFWDDMRRRLLGKGKHRFWRIATVLVCCCLLAGGFVYLSLLAGSEDSAILFGILMVLQSLIIVVSGPLAAVNFITKERERGTLELLFLTPISSYALVVQKFCARASLALIAVSHLSSRVHRQ